MTDRAAMIALFRSVALHCEMLSDGQLEARNYLTGRFPDAWLQAQRLGPFHPCEHEFCLGFSQPVTIH